MNVLEALPSILGAAAVVPPLLYLLSITFFDNRAEPAHAIVGSFLLATLSTYLLQIIPSSAIAWGAYLLDAISDFSGSPPAWLALSFLSTLVQSVIDVAAPEEAVKVLVLLIYSRRFLAFDHPMEGVVYGAAVGLGFAAYENMLLVVHMPDAWREHTVIRSLLTVPVHGALGIVAGVYVARARFGGALGAGHGRAWRWRSLAAAWLIPTGLHAIYNLPLLLVRNLPGLDAGYAHFLQTGGFIIGTGVVIAGARLVYRLSLAQVAAAVRHRHGSLLGFRSWRLDVVGWFASLLGALMVLAEVQALLQRHAFTLDRHVVILFGSALAALAIVLHHRSAGLGDGRAALQHERP